MKRHWLPALVVTLSLSLACLSTPHATAQPPVAADTVSVPQLLENLGSSDAKIASSAARSLGVIFAPGGRGGDQFDAVAKKLVERLGAASDDVRRESALALGRMRAKAAVEPLDKVMNDAEITVAIAAGEAIGQILPVAEGRTLLLAKAGEESVSVQAAAVHGLAPIAKAEDAGVFLKALPAKNWRTQLSAVRGLERTVRSGAQLKPADYDAVALVLGNEIVNAADAAMHFFLHIRNPASFQAVLRAADRRGDGGAEDTSWRGRTFALRTISHYRSDEQKEALPAVIRNLGDRTANVSNEARRILATLRKEHQLSQHELLPLLLVEAERAEPLPMRAGILREMNGDVEKQYASRVARVAAKTLTEAMEVKDQWPAREYAATLLGASGYTGEMLLLTRCLEDDTHNVRQAAVKALEQLQPLCTAEQSAVVAPAVQKVLVQSVDWRKTAAAARAVGTYAQAETIEPLVLLLGHSVLNVREAASRSLVGVVGGKSNELREAADKLTTAEVARNPAAWEAGAPVLGAVRDRKAIPLLTRVLQQGDWRAQAAAANAVALIAKDQKISDQPLADSLIKAAQSDILQVQEAANGALRVLNQ